MSTLQTVPLRSQSAHKRPVGFIPIGGMSPSVQKSVFEQVPSFHDYCVPQGDAIIQWENPNINLCPSSNARPVLAQMVSSGYVPGLDYRAGLYEDDPVSPRIAASITFAHFCKLLSVASGMFDFHEIDSVVLRVTCVKRDFTDPVTLFAQHLNIPGLNLWDIGLSPDDLRPKDGVMKQYVFARVP